MSSDREVARLWRVNRTIHELVRDRVRRVRGRAPFAAHFPSSQGYIVSDYEIELSLDEFRQQLTGNTGAINRDALHFYTTHASDAAQKIFVYFSDERNVGVATMRKFLSQLEDKEIGRGIIIFPDKMTASAHKVIDAMRAQFELEDFHEISLLVNITRHQLVPRHEVLSEEEKKSLLSR